MPRTKETPASSRAKPKSRTRKRKVKAEESTEFSQFHKFPELPMELRCLIIEAALDEDQKRRLGRVVLLDHHTRRISPTMDLAGRPSPLLYVDGEFRNILLKRVYARVEVLALEPPRTDQYGEPHTWYAPYDQTQYNVDVARRIDEEASENGVPMGYLYVNRKKDVFVIGSVPMQICETYNFEAMVPETERCIWVQPHYSITEPLPEDACAKVAHIRQLAWDPLPACPACDGYHEPCCEQCFFRTQGAELSRMYDQNTFAGVDSFGFYLLGGDENTLEQALVDIIEMGSKTFLQDWQDRYYNWMIKELVDRERGQI